jgi:hypothetical protein
LRILFDRVAYACLRGRRMRGRGTRQRGVRGFGGGGRRAIDPGLIPSIEPRGETLKKPDANTRVSRAASRERTPNAALDRVGGRARMIRALPRRGATSRAVARRGVAAYERDAARLEGFSAPNATHPGRRARRARAGRVARDPTADARGGRGGSRRGHAPAAVGDTLHHLAVRRGLERARSMRASRARRNSSRRGGRGSLTRRGPTL